MSIRRCALVSVVLSGLGLGGFNGGCWSCPDEELVPVEDGAYRERPTTDPGTALRDVVATVEGEALTIQYVDAADGRVYVVQLRERLMAR